MGIGALGAILSFVLSLSAINPSGVRYSLSAVQGLLKIALGALTAVIGLMVLTTLLSSDSTVLNSQLKLLVAAAVFGYPSSCSPRCLTARERICKMRRPASK